MNNPTADTIFVSPDAEIVETSIDSYDNQPEEQLEELAEVNIENISAIEPADQMTELDLPPDIPETSEEIPAVLESAEEPVPDDLFGDKPPWKAEFNALSERLKCFSKGIELPSEIFSACIEFLDIDSGIFLTYEKSSDLFVPFASANLDETSLRRCKISMNVIRENNLIFNGKIVHPSVKKTFLKNYLSKRLWDGINLLSVLVFSHHDDVFGILLIFNSVITDKPGFTDLASLLIRNSSEIFANSRSTLLRNLKSTEISPPLSRSESVEKISSDLISQAAAAELSMPVKIALIDYSVIISSMKEFDAAIDEYALEFDIFKMYSSMLGSAGYIQRIAEHCIFLTFLSKMNGNSALIRNQLEASLISLFEKNKLISNPKITVGELDLSGEDLSEKLSAFLN